MKYKLNKVDKISLTELLQLFTEEVLSEPLKNNSKHFQSCLKGFRTNKVPMHKLISVYYEDFSYSNSILCEFLEKKVQELFDEKGISKQLEEYDGNIIDLFFALKSITIKEKVNISIDTILAIAKIEYEKSILESIASGTQDICMLISTIDAMASEKEQRQLNEKIEKAERNAADYKKEREALKETLKVEMKKVADRQRIINQLTDTIKTIENDLSQVIRDKDEMNNSNKVLKVKCDEEKNKLELKKKECDSLKEVVEQMEAELKVAEKSIEKLKHRQLSSATVFDIVNDVISSMKDGTTDEAELKKYIKNTFSREDTLITSFETLQNKIIDSIKYICNMMDDNSINEKDLTTIKDMENDICVEFLISKSMYSLCARHIGQIAQKKDIYSAIQERN